MMVNIRLESDHAKTSPDALAVFLFDKAKQLPSSYRDADRMVGGLISQAMKQPELSAGRELVHVYYPQKGPRRLYIARLGEKDLFESNQLRIAASRLMQVVLLAKVKRLRTVMPGDIKAFISADHAAQAVADGFSIGMYSFTEYKGTVGTKPETGKAATIYLQIDHRLHRVMKTNLTIGQCVSAARRLASTPPNVANTSYIASTCRSMAKKHGLGCRIINARQAEQLGMGGLLAVGRAGSHPPLLICLEHKGKPGGRKKGPVLLVGKGITFDTGGYSLKSDGGKNMKYDKCGAVAVIGAMQAIASLKLSQHVVGLIPCAENMINHNAYRVDDIITFCNGVTVEVTNTDAEGRLILADALAWGTKTYKPTAVIDLATLTGGVVVALGSFCGGMFCNDDKLKSNLMAAAEATGEKLWQLPLWPEHRNMMKGTCGDLVNSADRKAHPIQGAAFLSYFVGPESPQKMPTIPWAHLDIAGMADVDTETPLYPKGPTGFGVRLLVETVQNM